MAQEGAQRLIYSPTRKGLHSIGPSFMVYGHIFTFFTTSNLCRLSLRKWVAALESPNLLSIHMCVRYSN